MKNRGVRKLRGYFYFFFRFIICIPTYVASNTATESPNIKYIAQIGTRLSKKYKLQSIIFLSSVTVSSETPCSNIALNEPRIA